MKGTKIFTPFPLTVGPARRLTYHPAEELLCDWTGRWTFAVLVRCPWWASTPGSFVCTRFGRTTAKANFPFPTVPMGALDATGKRLAYTPHSHDFRTWKTLSRWYGFGLLAVSFWRTRRQRNSLPLKVPIVYRCGTEISCIIYRTLAMNTDSNIWSLHTRTGERKQVTHFKPTIANGLRSDQGEKGQGEIVLQNGAELHLLDLATGKAEPIQVHIPGDRPKLRPEANRCGRVDPTHSSHSLRSSESPSKRARDVWTIPAKHGSPRNLTRTSGVAERDPACVPTAKWIAYLSDASGNTN